VIAATVCPSDVTPCAGLLDINLTFVVELVIFLVTIYALWRLIWRPIIDILDSRDHRIDGGQRAAAEAERRYTDGLAEVQSTLERARAEARDDLADAHRAAAAAAEQVRASAQQQARGITDEALAEIRGESDAAVASLRSQAQTLAVAAAGRLLGQELDDKRYGRVAAEAVRE
jgi:F-type H+-transporting ATPase subunit b